MNKSARAAKKELEGLPGGWARSVESDGKGANQAAYFYEDPGDPQSNFGEVRLMGGDWYASVGGYNPRRGMGDLIEEAGPFGDAATAARAARDLIKKHFHSDGRDGVPYDRRRDRSWGRTKSRDPEFDFGGMF
jgi:hypothetical protein